MGPACLRARSADGNAHARWVSWLAQVLQTIGAGMQICHTPCTPPLPACSTIKISHTSSINPAFCLPCTTAPTDSLHRAAPSAHNHGSCIRQANPQAPQPCTTAPAQPASHSSPHHSTTMTAASGRRSTTACSCRPPPLMCSTWPGVHAARMDHGCQGEVTRGCVMRRSGCGQQRTRASACLRHPLSTAPVLRHPC